MITVVIAMVGLMVISGGSLNPMMLIFPLMMGMSLLMMMSPTHGEDVNEMRRVYLRHLIALRDTALHYGEQQRQHQCYRNPPPHHLVQWVETLRLWERQSQDSDALEVRIGVGPTLLCTPIEMKNPGAPEDLDPVCAVSLRSTIRAVRTVHDVPISVQLQAFAFVMVTGDRAHDLVRAIIAQLCFHHGPECVGITVATTGADQPRWWKWLPHTKDPQSARFEVLIVDFTVAHPEQHDALITQILQSSATTVIILSEPDPDAPQRSDFMSIMRESGFQLDAGTNLVAVTESGREVLGKSDTLSQVAAEHFARSLTGKIRPQHQVATISDLRFLLGLGIPTPDTVSVRWEERGAQRLTVPLGLTDAGTAMMLDIKESAHDGVGPHGLCVGATGSGKSELLRTLVVAMAATHSPQSVNFVLVDFKGGATFLGLDALPHTSAVITNLEDEAVLVERMHDAISGEMNRRQELLRQAGNFINVGEFNQASSQGQIAHDPIPALFMVLDEFSELLGQHPDFADLFVAVGRLGRSLHIHLLLASQRLEEGRLRGLDSHLSYRIGLKTFSAAESRQVLGIPDAYEIPNQPGTGFIKTGADTIVKFRASYVSEPMKQARGISATGSATVRPWNGWEDEHSDTESITNEAPSMPLPTLVDAVVTAAQQRATELGLNAHKIWLPPLPNTLEISEVPAATPGQLTAHVGLIDRPYRQRQDPLAMSFEGHNGHAAICGGPQTGKTAALRTIVTALAAGNHTDAVRFYIADLSGQGLAQLQALPHVAGIASRHESEKLGRMVDDILHLIDHPEQRHTFFIIDGWHIVAQEHEHLVESFNRIAADGLAANIHLIITTPRWTTLRPAIRDLITQRLELKLGEALDSLIDRKAQSKLPTRPGVGLTPTKEHMMLARSSNQDIAHVAQLCSNQPQVPQLKLLPTAVELHELASLSEKEHTTGIRLGIHGRDLTTFTWDTKTSNHLLIFGSQGCGKSTTVATILAGICKRGPETARCVVIDHRRAHLGTIDPTMLAAYSASTTATEQTLASTVITLESRLPGPEITPRQLKQRSWWTGPDIFLVIDDADLVPEPLWHRLVELIPHSRDIGLHIVAARKIGGSQRALYQSLYSAIKDQSPMVLVMDGERDDGPLFGIRPQRLIAGRAIAVIRGSNQGQCHIAQNIPEIAI